MNKAAMAEITDKIKYYKSKLREIHIVGMSHCRQRRRRLHISQDSRQSNEGADPQTDKRDDMTAAQLEHAHFVNLIKYINDYKANICCKSRNLLNSYSGSFDDAVQAKYSAEQLFPRYESGPDRGKLIYARDAQGNIEIDPTANVVQDPLSLEYSLYCRAKYLAQNGQLSSQMTGSSKTSSYGLLKEKVKK